ncbi:MAG: hypothetical protein HY778_00365 [Betaproteobacteria bacterium]|nr:hypothetical protein [Betaproteobacteria bacterium]
MTQIRPGPDPATERRELMAVLAVVAAVMAAAAWACLHFPPWIDEAQFVDPAASLFFGKGWTSSAWPYQTPEEFWMGNAPLYTGLVYVWMKLFGFGLLEARSLNHVLLAMSAVTFWVAIRRLQLVGSAAGRVLMVALILTGLGVAHDSWSARYDMLTVAVVAAATLAFSATGRRTRLGFLALIGFVAPLAGFHLAVYLAVFALYLLWPMRLKVLREAAALGCGMAAGVAFLLGVAAARGLLKKFLLITFGSKHVISGQVGQALMQGDLQGVARLLDWPSIYYQDPSLSAVLGVAAIMAGFALAGRVRIGGRELVFLLGVAVVIPTVVFLAGKFPLAYSWMAYIPCVVWVARHFPDVSVEMPAPVRSAGVVLLGLAMAAGLGALLVEAHRTSDMGHHGQYAQRIAAEVKRGELVYADFEAYFAARRHAGRVFVPTYGQTGLVPGIPESAEITVLVLRPENVERTLELVGGQWVEVAAVSAVPAGIAVAEQGNPFHARIFRRSAPAAVAME